MCNTKVLKLKVSQSFMTQVWIDFEPFGGLWTTIDMMYYSYIKLFTFTQKRLDAKCQIVCLYFKTYYSNITRSRLCKLSFDSKTSIIFGASNESFSRLMIISHSSHTWHTLHMVLNDDNNWNGRQPVISCLCCWCLWAIRLSLLFVCKNCVQPWFFCIASVGHWYLTYPST